MSWEFNGACEEYMNDILRLDDEAYRRLKLAPTKPGTLQVYDAYQFVKEKAKNKDKPTLKLEKSGNTSSVIKIFNDIVNDIEVFDETNAGYILRVGNVDVKCSEKMFKCLRAIFIIGVGTSVEQAEGCKKIGEILLMGKLKNIPEKTILGNLKSYKSDNYYFNILSKEILKIISE